MNQAWNPALKQAKLDRVSNPRKWSKMLSTIRVELTRTINLGNYESTRISIALEDNVLQTNAVKQEFTRIYKFVEDELNIKVEEVQEQLKPKPKKQILIRKGKLK